MNSVEQKVLAATDKEVAATICELCHEALLFYAIGLCKSFGLDQHQARDLLQEFYLKVLNNPSMFQAGFTQKGVGYFQKAMKNMLIDRNRALNIHTLGMDEVSEYQLPEVSLYYLCPEMVQQHFYNLIETALRGEESLPTINLYVDGYSYKDIAAKLDIPIGTVSSQINRAKKKLCAYYKDEDFKRFGRYKKRAKLFDNPESR